MPTTLDSSGTGEFDFECSLRRQDSGSSLDSTVETDSSGSPTGARRQPGLAQVLTSSLVVLLYPVCQPHELIPEFSRSTNLDVVNTATPTLQPDVSSRPYLGYAGRLTQPERHACQWIDRGQQLVQIRTPCLMADSAQLPASLEGSAHLHNDR